jgi:hypothetical protein
MDRGAWHAGATGLSPGSQPWGPSKYTVRPHKALPRSALLEKTSSYSSCSSRTKYPLRAEGFFELAIAGVCGRPKNKLTCQTVSPSIPPTFHQEWRRDWPYDATATGFEKCGTTRCQFQVRRIFGQRWRERRPSKSRDSWWDEPKFSRPP